MVFGEQQADVALSFLPWIGDSVGKRCIVASDKRL